MTAEDADNNDAYSPEEERPLKGYAVALGVYSVFAGALALAGWRRQKHIPASISLGDFALVSLGTHKVARIIAKDAVTSPVRAPFTRYVEPTGAAELNEEVRAKGALHGIGELVSCPFCLAVWVSTSFVGGLTFAPRFTRRVAAVFSATALSDALQLAYDKLKQAE